MQKSLIGTVWRHSLQSRADDKCSAGPAFYETSNTAGYFNSNVNLSTSVKSKFPEPISTLLCSYINATLSDRNRNSVLLALACFLHLSLVPQFIFRTQRVIILPFVSIISTIRTPLIKLQYPTRI